MEDEHTAKRKQARVSGPDYRRVQDRGSRPHRWDSGDQDLRASLKRLRTNPYRIFAFAPNTSSWGWPELLPCRKRGLEIAHASRLLHSHFRSVWSQRERSGVAALA